MKKSLLLAAVLSLGLVASCGQTSSVATAKNFKVGLGSVVNVTADATTKVVTQIDVTFASVVFDAESKVVSTYIDALQIPFTYTAAAGDVAATLVLNPAKNQTKDAGAKIVETKKELGTRYGMSKVDSDKDGTMNKEWDVQAAAYEDWTVGKTVAQVAAGTQTTGDKAGYGTAEVIATGATMHVADFSKAIADAATRTKDYKATAGGVAGVGVIVGSLAAKTGYWQIDVSFAADSKATDKINQTILDAYQFPIATAGTFDATKTQTKDAGASLIESKKDLGTRYGMSKVDSDKDGTMNKEWDVQAKALEDWTVGKTAALVTGGIQTTGEKAGYGTADVIAIGATIHVGDLLNAIAEGMTNSK